MTMRSFGRGFVLCWNGKATFRLSPRPRLDIDACVKAPARPLLLDLSMPSGNGLDAIGRIRQVALRCRVLVLSMHSAPEYVRPALRAGAQGYLVKGSGLSDLLRAVRVVLDGGQFSVLSLRRSCHRLRACPMRPKTTSNG